MSIYESFYGNDIKQITVKERNINNTNIEAYPEDLKESSDDMLILESDSEPMIENNENAPIPVVANEEEDLNSLEGNEFDLTRNIILLPYCCLTLDF